MNYSFTGASIAEDVKTVSVRNFSSNAPLANVNLSQSMSEALRDKFLSQTNLDVIAKNGDLHFEGSINGYTIKSVAIQGNETAALNRLTITVKVKFVHSKDDKQSFESSFSRFAEFDSQAEFTSIEEGLIKEINEQLIQDIFNKSVSNW